MGGRETSHDRAQAPEAEDVRVRWSAEICRELRASLLLVREMHAGCRDQSSTPQRRTGMSLSDERLEEIASSLGKSKVYGEITSALRELQSLRASRRPDMS